MAPATAMPEPAIVNIVNVVGRSMPCGQETRPRLQAPAGVCAADLPRRRALPPVERDVEGRASAAGLVDLDASAAVALKRVVLAGVSRRGNQKRRAPERGPFVHLPRHAVAERACLNIRGSGAAATLERS